MPTAKPKAQKPAAGVQLPIDAKTGKRSSAALAKELLSAAALAASDPATAESVRKEKDWRWCYAKHFTRQTEVGARRPDNAVVMAEAALGALHDRAEFVAPDGTASKLRDAVAAAVGAAPTLATAEVRGEKEWGAGPELRLPLGGGAAVEGDALKKAAAEWATGEWTEPDAAATLSALAAERRGWLDLRGWHFAVIGAASQMGPTAALLDWGATVHAVDIPVPAVWRQLIAMARASRGTLLLPCRPGTEGGDDAALAASAGVDLLNNTPAVANWVVGQAPGKRLIIGTYAYGDGERFVRIATACDAVVAAVCTARKDTAVASLCSPTEVFVVPAAAQKVAAQRAAQWGRSPHTLWHAPIRIASKSRYLEPNVASRVPQPGDAPPLLVQDSIVWTQGPNYMLAKHIQRWRAVACRAAGHVVSANVAPASLTPSVMSNRLVAAGMMGCAHFGIHAFDAVTSRWAMAALLVADLRDEASAAHPATPLANPLCIFTTTSFHGGTWRCAYKTNSYTEVSALVYAAPYAGAAAAAVAGAAVLRGKL